MILAPLAFGFLTIALAVDQRFARGKVVFDDQSWRIVLGAIGAFVTYRAARAVVRTINGAPMELSPEETRRQRLRGWIFWLTGGAILLAVFNDEIAQRSVAFRSWTRPVYVAGGIFLVLTGALSRIDGYKIRQKQRERLQRGEELSPYLDE
jgi:uncharacterized membrane protein